MDRFVRTRQERVAYGKEASQRYNDEELGNVKAVLEKDFLFWTGKHFKSVPIITISNFRDNLLKHNVPTERRPGLRISIVLAQYILNVRTESFTEHGSRPKKKSNKEAQPNGQRRSGFKRRIEPNYSAGSARADGEDRIIQS